MTSPNDSFKKSSDESKRNAQTVSPKKQREADADVQRHVSKKKKKSTSPLRASCLGGCVPDQFTQAHIRLSPLLSSGSPDLAWGAPSPLRFDPSPIRPTN
ncbi:hypothetical protein QL285_015882 [Trifolium repens]|nr:hypothetical protein QL285_015882 [Trifolium repens]